jgi:transposase
MTVTVLDRALVAGDAGGVTGERQERPDPEVPEKARRRTFTAQYKLDVVAEYDAAATGEKGAVLRREGLYSSHVIEWRRARDAGALAGPGGRAAAQRLIRAMRRSPGCADRLIGHELDPGSVSALSEIVSRVPPPFRAKLCSNNLIAGCIEPDWPAPAFTDSGRGRFSTQISTQKCSKAEPKCYMSLS